MIWTMKGPIIVVKSNASFKWFEPRIAINKNVVFTSLVPAPQGDVWWPHPRFDTMSSLFSAQPRFLSVAHSPSSSSSGFNLPVCLRGNSLLFRHGFNMFQLENGLTIFHLMTMKLIFTCSAPVPSFCVETGPEPLLVVAKPQISRGLRLRSATLTWPDVCDEIPFYWLSNTTYMKFYDVIWCYIILYDIYIYIYIIYIYMYM